MMTDHIPAIGANLDPTRLTLGRFMGINGWLYTADEARRNNPHLSRMMEHDPDIIAAMRTREYAVIGQPWTIETSMPDDPIEVARADAVEQAIRRSRHWLQIMEHLSRAYWWGSSAATVRYEVIQTPVVGRSLVSATGKAVQHKRDAVSEMEQAVTIAPAGYLAVHGDSIVARQDGSIGVLTGLGIGSSEGERVETGPTGPVRVIDDRTRRAMIVHVWGLTGPHYEDARSPARAITGRGLRDYVWFAWLNKQTITQSAILYCERLARGTIAIHHMPGTEGRQQAKQVADAMQASNVVLVPDQGPDPTMKVDILEPSGTGYQVLTDFSREMAADIAKCILNQTLMTETGSTGLGSGVAEQHRATMDRVVEHDAILLAETLSRDFAQVVYDANFSQHGGRASLSWKFGKPVGEASPAERIEMADRLARIGVSVSAEDLRSTAGFSTPDPGEEQTAAGGVSSGAADDGFAGRLADALGVL